jgi:hypothetical protein
VARLIDADALKNELSDKYYITYTHEYGDAIPVGWIMSAIDNAPTVDTTFKEFVAYECGQKSVERPTGHWIEHYDTEDGFTWLTCSRCMFKAYEEDYNFCPNCGADMRKEAEE